MELSELRQQIDIIDDQLVDLFCERMRIAHKVAKYKKSHGLPIYVPAREEEVIKKVSEKAGIEFEEDIQALFGMLFDLSRKHQSKVNSL